MDSSLGIVVPAYDPDVSRLRTYVESLAGLDPDVIRIELDDPTGTIAERLGSLPAGVAVSTTRRGKGAAITAGFEALDADVYCFVDADGSTDIESVERLIATVRSGEADLAVGSRRHPDAVISDTQSRLRGSMGDGFAWLARRLLPVSLYDYQCGAKAIGAESWELVRNDLYEPGFGWDVNLVAAAGYHELSVAEVPVTWSDHAGSTVDPARASITLGGSLCRAQRFRFFGSTGRPPLLERRAERE